MSELNQSNTNISSTLLLAAMYPELYERAARPSHASSMTASGRRTLVWPACTVAVGGIIIRVPQRYLDIDVGANWDDVSTISYNLAAIRAGKDFSVFVTSGGKVLLSPNTIAPVGYTTANSRRIGGFHCVCVSYGTIDNDLSGFIAGDVLPPSIWDLQHRSSGSQAGTAFVAPLNDWWMIYMQSGTGPSTASVFGGTITDGRDSARHVADLEAVGMRLPSHDEFQIAAQGSNLKTNIAGSADPVVTGGYVDTAGRRMVSRYGLEGMCGQMWQWLSDIMYRNDDASYNGTWGWKTQVDNQGSWYSQGGIGVARLLGGGTWYHGSACGPRARSSAAAPWPTYSRLGARGCARSRNT